MEIYFCSVANHILLFLLLETNFNKRPGSGLGSSLQLPTDLITVHIPNNKFRKTKRNTLIPHPFTASIECQSFVKSYQDAYK